MKLGAIEYRAVPLSADRRAPRGLLGGLLFLGWAQPVSGFLGLRVPLLQLAGRGS